MAINDPRFVFAGLCWFGMLAISFGAVMEIREKLAGNSLSPLHFWVRMSSVICWLVSLGLMSFAVYARWPKPEVESTKHIFAQFLLTGLSFLILAFLISFVDFLLFWRLRNAQRHYLADQMDQWVREQIEEKEKAIPEEDQSSQSE